MRSLRERLLLAHCCGSYVLVFEQIEAKTWHSTTMTEPALGLRAFLLSLPSFHQVPLTLQLSWSHHITLGVTGDSKQI